MTVNARSFNSTSDYITLPSGFNPTGINFSIAVWINPQVNAFRGTRAILCATSGGAGFNFQLNSGTPSILVLDVTATSVVGSSSGTIIDGSWYHVGMTWNNATGDWQFYINGLPSGSGTTAASFTSATYEIGAFAIDFFYGGALADMAVWNTILTGTQFSSLAAGNRANNVGVTANLIGHWPILGQSPEPDKSGNGYDGTLVGTTVVAGPPSLQPYAGVFMYF